MFDFFLLQFTQTRDISKARLFYTHLTGKGGLKNATKIASNAYPQVDDWFAPLVDAIKPYFKRFKQEKLSGQHPMDAYLSDLFDRLYPDFIYDGVLNAAPESFSADELALPHLRWLTQLQARVAQCGKFPEPYLLARVHPALEITDEIATQLISLYKERYIRVMGFQDFLQDYLRSKTLFGNDGQTLDAFLQEDMKEWVQLGDSTGAITERLRRKYKVHCFFLPVISASVDACQQREAL